MKDEAKFLKLAQERLASAIESHGPNRDKSIADLEFLEGGSQWPEDLKADRIAASEPCLEINKIPAHLDQVVGDQRQNRPSIKIIPFDSESDPETAEILSGLVRNIEYTSSARVAYDHAFEHAAASGEGFFQINTEYARDDIFEQNIAINPILNSSTVHWEPGAEKVDLSDADWFIVETKMLRTEFEKKYPGSALVGWNETDEYDVEWVTKDEIKLAAYWLKEPVTKTICQVLNEDGSTKVVDDIKGIDEESVVKKREVKTNKVVRYLITSHDVLEGPDDFASKYIPIVPVWGKELNIAGRRVLRGIVRHAKDPQRLYNYSRSQGAAVTALSPKAPFLATPKQLKGHTKQWDQAHKKNFMYLYYNPDPEAPGPPKRQPPPQASSAIQAEIMISDHEIDDTTGMHEASRGEKSNEKSGKAIIARDTKGRTGNYAYMDNLARSLTYAGRILLDLIPNIYDTERVVRIMNEDETTQHVKINSSKDGKPFNDITTGKYDAMVTVGPSYTTQREEARDGMMQFIGAYPGAAPIIGDLIAKNSNWPGADDISDRLKMLLPPGMLKEDEKPKPGGGQAPQQPGQPPPGSAAPAGENPQLVKLEIQTAMVKLKQEEATLQKKIAEAKIAQMKAQQPAEGGQF